MAIRVERLSSHFAALSLLIIVMLGPSGVAAQQGVVPLQFSFSDPGARAMGFGGAFVGLADDATAALSNPAGLVQLLKPEVSVEGRNWNYSTPFTAGGRLEGDPTGIGIDTDPGLRMMTSEHEESGVSFLSLAYPLGKWSLALFRHELSNLEFVSETQGLFGDGTGCCPLRETDQRAASDLEILSYGLSVAYRISDRFALGLGLVYHDAAIETSATLFLPDDDSFESLYEPNSFLPERSLLSQSSSSNDSDWALGGGFLWRPSANWSIGGVYRRGPEIEIENLLTAGEAYESGVPPGEVLFQQSGIPIEFPDVFGLGFAYRADNGRLTVSFQWDHIEYSSIVESLELDDQTIDDADELHLGAEYVFLGSTPIFALRLGMWLDPDHQLRATVDDPFLRALLPAGDDDIHLTAGLGVVFQRFQVDLGVDLADRVDAVSVSAIYGF